MARAVALAGGLRPADGGLLAIDWGYSNTTLCVVGDDRPLYTRRLHGCGFGKVLDEVCRVFGVSLDEAQHLMDTQGVVAPEEASPHLSPDSGKEPAGLVDKRTQAALTDAAEDTIDELVQQIGRTLRFMDAQRRHLHPAAIWLMGGGASMCNVGPYLSQSA